MKRFLVSILIFFSLFSLSAEKSFYQAVIKGNYLSDFGYGAFPLSLWAEFGIKGMEAIQGKETKLYVKVEGGLSERTLRQYPLTGDIISLSNYKYSVAYSDVGAFFKQGLIGKENEDDILSITIMAKIRWEQAFATFSDIREKNYGGIFSNSSLFPQNSYKFLPGTPELSGTMYSVFTTLGASLSVDFMTRDYLKEEGLEGTLDCYLTPFWLFNNLPFLEGGKCDTYNINLSGVYSYTFLSRKNRAKDFNKISIFSKVEGGASALFGSAITKIFSDRFFIDTPVLPRTLFLDLYYRLVINGPEFISKGTFPSFYFFGSNGVGVGNILNSVVKREGTDLYGGFGLGIKMHLMGYFSASVEYRYVYLSPYKDYRGGGFKLSCHLEILFS